MRKKLCSLLLSDYRQICTYLVKTLWYHGNISNRKIGPEGAVLIVLDGCFVTASVALRQRFFFRNLDA